MMGSSGWLIPAGGGRRARNASLNITINPPATVGVAGGGNFARFAQERNKPRNSPKTRPVPAVLKKTPAASELCEARQAHERSPSRTSAAAISSACCVGPQPPRAVKPADAEDFPDKRKGFPVSGGRSRGSNLLPRQPLSGEVREADRADQEDTTRSSPRHAGCGAPGPGKRRSRSSQLPAPFRPRCRRPRRARHAVAGQRPQGRGRPAAASRRDAGDPQERLHALLGRLHGHRRGRQRRVDWPGAGLGQPDQSRLALLQGRGRARRRAERTPAALSDETRERRVEPNLRGIRRSTRSATS